jgi:hypothetical protein
MNIAYSRNEVRAELLKIAADHFRRRIKAKTSKNKLPKLWMQEWLTDLERAEARDLSDSALASVGGRVQ